MGVLDELNWRGLIFQATEGVGELFANETVTTYIGFDPSAASLHVGSLLPIMALARLQRAGHKPIAIAGGGTGLIGDPSGKTTERKLLTREQIDFNLVGIKQQLARFLDFSSKGNPAQIINNADWLCPMRLMDFLRDTGKYFTVNYMLAKESVRRRLEQEDGISFTEFSYMLLQAYDFLLLFDRFGCKLQMGGSDQLGNILAGMDLIRRVLSEQAYGLVFPHVSTSSGVKFGKTEAGTVWLCPTMTSPFRFYQFWFNTDDRDVITYLKYFTWLARDEIEHIAEQHERNRAGRGAQRLLAREVTKIAHGDAELAKAERASTILFGGAIGDITAAELEDVFVDVPSSGIAHECVDAGMRLPDLVVQTGLASSKGEARRLIQGGGLYLNNQRVSELDRNVGKPDIVAERFLVLRKGQRQYHLIRVEG